jgi:DNA-binding FrmR family transcriptional regulator
MARKGGSRTGAAKVTRPAGKGGPASQPKERPHQRQVMHRLRRVEGQIRGVLAMMEKDESCDVIAQQLSAARKALDRAFYEMMACSLEMEVNESSGDSSLCERISEKTRLLAKYA